MAMASNKCVIREYLIHCYLDEVQEFPLLVKTEARMLVDQILSTWDFIKSPYKHLISYADLFQSNRFLTRNEDFPENIKDEAITRLSEYYQEYYKDYSSVIKNKG